MNTEKYTRNSFLPLTSVGVHWLRGAACSLSRPLFAYTQAQRAARNVLEALETVGLMAAGKRPHDRGRDRPTVRAHTSAHIAAHTAAFTAAFTTAFQPRRAEKYTSVFRPKWLLLAVLEYTLHDSTQCLQCGGTWPNVFHVAMFQHRHQPSKHVYTDNISERLKRNWENRCAIVLSELRL